MNRFKLTQIQEITYKLLAAHGELPRFTLAALQEQVHACSIDVKDERSPFFLDICVPPSAQSADIPDGPLGSPYLVATDESGKVLLWIEAGYIDAIEYAWFTDMPPLVWPDALDLAIRDF